MLAGLVKAPSALNPLQHPQAALARQRLVLQAMVETKKLTPDQAWRARRVRFRPVETLPVGGYFADWAAPQVKQNLDAQYGEIRVRPRWTPLPAPGRADRPRLAGRSRPAAGRDAGGAGGDAAGRVGGGHGRRARLWRQPVQPRGPGAAPARLGLQAVRLPGGAAGRLATGLRRLRGADLRRRLDAPQIRAHRRAAAHPARRLRPVQQHRRGPPGAGGRPRPHRPGGAGPGRRQPPGQRRHPAARHLGDDPAGADLGLCRGGLRPHAGPAHRGL